MLKSLRAMLIMSVFCGQAFAYDRTPVWVSARVLDTVLSPVAADDSLRPMSVDVPVVQVLPKVGVTTVGPASLVVNKASEHRIVVNNSSDAEATGIHVRCVLPAWVDLEDVQAVSGSVHRDGDELSWAIPVLAKREQVDLKLRLIPRQGRAFDLNVELMVKPANVQKRITVQQPELSLKLDGPKSVRFDEVATWELTVSNPGTGLLEDVSFDVFTGEERVTTFEVGSIDAGQKQLVALRLNPREAGRHVVRVVAKAGDMQEVTEGTISVRRGKLVIQLSGTDSEFAGTPMGLDIEVNNNGDDILENVLLSLELPKGVTYLQGLPNVSKTETGVSWVVSRIPVGEKLNFPVTVEAASGGDHVLRVTGTTMDRGEAESQFTTKTLTAPDLRLDVRDPVGPRTMDKIVEYEIRVTNQGTADAKQIAIVAICDKHLEAVDVTGNAILKEGKIFFKPTKLLKPGHAIVHVVKVKPLTSGAHDFRVIVQAVEPEDRLAVQETTRFLGAEPSSALGRAEPDPDEMPVLAKEPAKIQRYDATLVPEISSLKSILVGRGLRK